jgi:hypothetical protein
MYVWPTLKLMLVMYSNRRNHLQRKFPIKNYIRGHTKSYYLSALQRIRALHHAYPSLFFNGAATDPKTPASSLSPLGQSHHKTPQNGEGKNLEA